jgi:hypothetical protein
MVQNPCPLAELHFLVDVHWTFFMILCYQYTILMSAAIHTRSYIFPPFKEMLQFDLLLLALLILATRLATLLHELIGHALVAWISGGDIHSIHISLFGGGSVSASLGQGPVCLSAIFGSGGLLVNAATGALPVLIIRKPDNINIIWGLFWSLFSVVSLAGTSAYLVTGLYYKIGDPVSLIVWSRHPVFVDGLWIPFLLISPWSIFVGVKLYASFQERVFKSETFFMRLFISAGTLGVAVLVYAVMFFCTQQSLVSADASKLAFSREKARILKAKRIDLYNKMQQIHPELPEEQLWAKVDQTVVHVDKDRVPTPFPIIPVLAVFFFAGGFAALHQTSAACGNNQLPGMGSTLGITAISAGVLFLLFSLG